MCLSTCKMRASTCENDGSRCKKVKRRRVYGESWKISFVLMASRRRVYGQSGQTLWKRRRVYGGSCKTSQKVAWKRKNSKV